LAWTLIDGNNFRVHEPSIDHILISAGLESSEGHDAIANNDALKVDLLSLSVLVVQIDQHSQIGDVLASVGFPSDEEEVLSVLWELGEEIEQGIEVVVGRFSVVVGVVLFQVVGVAYACWWLEEEQVGTFVPWVVVFFQTVANFVVNSVLEVVGSDFLDESLIRHGVPRSELQPGPPLSHRVRGSELFAPLTDSTKT